MGCTLAGKQVKVQARVDPRPELKGLEFRVSLSILPKRLRLGFDALVSLPWSGLRSSSCSSRSRASRVALASNKG